MNWIKRRHEVGDKGKVEGSVEDAAGEEEIKKSLGMMKGKALNIMLVE